MSKSLLKNMSLVSLLCLTITLAGCTNIGSYAIQSKYERTIQLSAPLSLGSTFETLTHNGSIKIAGADIAKCNLTATITARAISEEEAQKLAEKTTIKLEPFGNRLIAKIDKPAFLINQSVSVDLDVEVPNESDLELTTHNGWVSIRDITGEINSTTHNGRITAQQVSGDTRLKTHNGSVRVYYSEAAPSVCNVSLITYNGDIELKTPSNFSCEVNLSTNNGSIITDLPIATLGSGINLPFSAYSSTIVGKVTKTKLSGKIGSGLGRMHLETHNGLIRIK